MPLTWEQKKNAWRLYGGVAKKIAAQTVASTGAISYGSSLAAKYYAKTRKTGTSRVKMGKARRVKGKPRVTARVIKITRKTPVVRKRAGPIPHTKVASIKKRFPEKLYQIYHITNDSTYVELEAGKQGTITNPDQIYSTPSTNPSNASIMLFNVSCTENHWFPQGVPTSQGIGYRTGNQLVGIDNQLPGYGALTGTSQNESFIYRNNATSTNLQSKVCPMFQSGLAESSSSFIDNSVTQFYNIPNNILESVSYKLRFSNPLIAPQKLSVKIVKYDNGDETPLHPASMGDTQADMESHIRTLCNARTWTGRGFKTLDVQTIYMPGLRGGTKQQFHTLSKSLTLNYLRSQYRKTYNANNMGTLGIQASPSFGLADDGFFNAVYIIVSSTLTTDTYVATVEVEKNATNPETKETGIPQIATYPPTGLDNVGYTQIGNGAHFGVQGTVTVNHRVKETQRAIGHAESAQLSLLQQQIDDLKLNSKPKVETESDSD